MEVDFFVAVVGFTLFAIGMWFLRGILFVDKKNPLEEKVHNGCLTIVIVAMVSGTIYLIVQYLLYKIK